MRRRACDRGAVLLRVAVAVVVLLGLAGGGLALARAQEWGPFAPGDPQERNVLAEKAPYVDPDSRTLQAAMQVRADGRDDDAALLKEIAAVPSGIWLTPEQYPPGSVGGYVASVSAAAMEADQAPLFVIYGIPDRDCSGGYSSGGLDEQTYGPWVAEIASAIELSQVEALVVLEPDALASAIECDEVGDRVRLMKQAVDTLVAAGVTTYVDAGHSDWISSRKMAALLSDVGVERVRGIAVNVSNYQTDADEDAYAERLSEQVGGTHWVVDRGRNGNGSTDDWCNPEGRALGDRPGFVDDGTGLDAYLWVKPPAESDGTCHGGPPAGEVWVDRALELARNAGW